MEEEISNLYEQSEYFKIFEKLAQLKSKQFTSFKYLNVVHNIGDDLAIQLGSSNSDATIVQISRIFQIVEPQSQKIIPLIEGFKYFKKADLPMKFQEFFDYISEHEVMLSEYRIIFAIDQIKDAAQVLTMKQFEELDKPDQYHYFQRAQINTLTSRMEPSPSLWPKICQCNTPYNPDYPYIQCDGCDVWFHLDCVKMSKKEADSRQKWHCRRCDKSFYY